MGFPLQEVLALIILVTEHGEAGCFDQHPESWVPDGGKISVLDHLPFEVGEGLEG